MSEAKHTPGPWDYFVGNANGRGLVRIETANDAPVAGIHIASMVRGTESEANACLIAAAPDMLAALQILHKWFEVTGSSINARWDRIPPLERKAIVDATRAAISRAGAKP
ncbi:MULTISPECIES: hypothetical protein [unclassified Mesorhizobium]|uniref:hypothetical protein n=1 Tax=unclassified Mesorhizobium TaxID=325217 RepID=UPI00112EDFAB|nr:MULTISPECIES: hypothetical protein [unclassified Mesorhizobium]TPK42266.1 hypothetical protein FJ550_29975 [Mesorhizobium sp. B2-5-2]TPL44539.1 hypothetical protein FJ961_04165 [Mesorhizobium sp. B2-4-5]TPM68726.1 hypothetical protein FJ968_29970 [Mesorhizobium sp. B2-1-6]TPN71714.1 hypothetical protein FJ985_30480 [Mesorhizobium sp. B1-1-2]